MADNNKNYQEIPIEAEENSSVCEFPSFCEENNFYVETKAISQEYIGEQEYGGGEGESKSSSNKGASNSKLATGVVAVAGVAVLAISVLGSSASFTQFDIYGTSVDYTLETTIEYVTDDTYMLDYDNFDTNLRIITYSDQTDQSEITLLETGNEDLNAQVEVVSSNGDGGELKITFDGRIDGLYEGTSYTTQVVGEDSDGNMKVYLTKNFTTTGAQTVFSEISWECKCAIDGCFYFTLKYFDDNGYYENFYFRLISETTGETFAEGELVNPLKTQCVNVEEAIGMDYILEISFDSSSLVDIANGETHKVYNVNVKI